MKKYTVGEFGDPAGYEESLYQTPGGLYFLYFRGGPQSPYAQEDIKCLSVLSVTFQKTDLIQIADTRLILNGLTIE